MITEVTGEHITYTIGGLGALGFIGRWAITWLGKQGLIQATDSNTKDLQLSLKEEAAKWELKYEKSAADLEAERTQHAKDRESDRIQHNDNLILLGEVRLQNKLLRALLLQRGMTVEELTLALGGVDGTD